MKRIKNTYEDRSVRQKAHDGVDSMMDKADSARESAEEGMEYLNERGERVKENVNGYIRENPGQSVLIAAGVGAVAGAILAAAMMRRRQ